MKYQEVLGLIKRAAAVQGVPTPPKIKDPNVIYIQRSDGLWYPTTRNKMNRAGMRLKSPDYKS